MRVITETDYQQMLELVEELAESGQDALQAVAVELHEILCRAQTGGVSLFDVGRSLMEAEAIRLNMQ
jgi:hypothetical protein